MIILMSVGWVGLKEYLVGLGHENMSPGPCIRYRITSFVFCLESTALSFVNYVQISFCVTRLSEYRFPVS